MYFKNGRKQSKREEEIIVRLRHNNVHPAAIRKYRDNNCVGCSQERKNCLCNTTLLTLEEQVKILTPILKGGKPQ